MISKNIKHITTNQGWIFLWKDRLKNVHDHVQNYHDGHDLHGHHENGSVLHLQ